MAEIIVGGGSRGWKDFHAVRAYFLQVEPRTIVITGGAEGADKMIEKVCAELHLRCLVLEPLWGVFGRAAGQIRNDEMLDLGATKCVAFWDGKSPGAKGLIDKAKKRKIPTTVVKYGR